MNTVIIGAVFVDVKGFSRDHYVPTGTNIGSVRFVHGGVARNVCENFARQGEKPVFVSTTDRSALSQEVRQRLSALGVDLRHMLFCENGMGMWLAILDNHGDLVGSVSRQPDLQTLQDHVYECGDEIISDADIVILEIDLNEAIAGHALKLAEKYSKPVYSMVGNMGVIMRHPEYLRQLRCFICNEIEASKLFGEDLTTLTPDEMLKVLLARVGDVGCHSMVITMGSDGAVYYDGDTGASGHCPAEPAVMKDSTGAGDAFFSGTVLALNRGLPLSKAVVVGSKMAAATIACDESCCPCLENLFD